MRISNILWLAGLACWSGGAILLDADELTLANGDARLTGTVRSIDAAGVVEVSSELSPDTLLLKSGAVEKVVFSSKDTPDPPTTALIELANGDFLPATLEGLDEGKLAVTLPDAGRLEIPRDFLKSLQIGIARRKVVYSGPKNLDEWGGGEGGMKNWAIEGKSMIANGVAKASRKDILPQQFILRFTLEWENKLSPNFEVYFADPLLEKGVTSDRYFFRFNSAGLEIKREATKGKHYSQIVQLNRLPSQYADHRLKVEIRVDRKGSRLKLFLNGEAEGEYPDRSQPVPDGTGVTLVCNAQNGNPHRISDIEVLELDDSHGRHGSEERGDPKSDSLISREDDRWSGRLMGIRKTAEGAVFHFKNDFQKDPLEIPEAEVSTVYFATREEKKPEGKNHHFVLRLRGEGSLQVSSCQFKDNVISAVHPLLGVLNFRREGIVAMERASSKTKTTAKP